MWLDWTLTVTVTLAVGAALELGRRAISEDRTGNSRDGDRVMTTTTTPPPARFTPRPRDERRAVPRSPVISSRARLVWGEGRPPYHAVPARLIDISERGAQVCTDRVPAHHDRVWVRLDAVPWEWVRATVCAVRGTAPCCRVHLAFPEPCPAGVLEEAIAPEPAEDVDVDPGPRIHMTFDFERD
jgi:PilZ domain